MTTNGAFLLTTRHAPISAVTTVTHLRLGTQFSATIQNAAAGTILLSGRFAPQIGDLIEVTYIWSKPYLGYI